MDLDTNPQSASQAAAQAVEQQSVNAPSVAIAPAASQTPMAGALSPAPVHPLVAGTAQTALTALNNAPPKPGNFARSVLTGVLHTMSKLGGGTEKVMAGLSQPGGGLDTLSIMAGSKPGQEYNNIQAAKAARQAASQKAQEFDLNQHLNHARLAYSEFQLSHGQDEANTAAETNGQNEVKSYEQNNGHLIKGDLLAAESAKYFGQKVNGQPVEIIRTGSRITGYDPSGQPIKKPTYSAIVAGPGGVPLSQADIDTISKYDPQFKDATPGQLMNAGVRRDMLQKAQAAELAQDNINRVLAATNLDVTKTKGEEAKQVDVKSQRDSLDYLSSVMAQTNNPDPLAAYQTIVREQAQVDPKTGQPTPTAIKARQMLPGVMASLKGPNGIAALETNRDKAEIDAHKAAQGGKLTPEQTDVEKESERLASARMSNLNAWNRAKDEANAADAAVKGVDPHAKNYAALQTAKLKADAKAASAQTNFQAASTDYYTYRSTQYRAAFPQSAPAASGLQPGQSVLYDPQGNPHAVKTKLVPQYLASSQYKGWASTPPSPAPVKK